MTPEQAAWVREHAWTDAMRSGLTGPARHRCACQDDHVTGWACRADQCHRCDYGEPVAYETTIRRHGGLRPASLPTPMRHEPRTAYGTRTMAMVWLADRVCCRVCSCSCHVPAPTQLGLFAGV